MKEGLYLRSANLDLRAEQIGEQVALHVRYRPGRENRARCNDKMTRRASVALQICFKPEVLVDVEYQSSPTAIQAIP